MTPRFLDGTAESLMTLYQDWEDEKRNRFSDNKGEIKNCANI